MIIEFIGSTGAGKTTLISAVQNRLAQTTEVVAAFDGVAVPLGFHGITHATARNLIQELVGLPYFLHSLPQHRAVVTYTLRMLARQGNFSLSTISNLRSLERKIGMFEIIRRRGRGRIILVDEGTVLLAHNIFVFTETRYTAEEIAGFAGLIPLPDSIIYVRAPVDDLVERSIQRVDRRRELDSLSRARLEDYLGRAVALFDQLVASAGIRERVLIVENPDSTDGERSDVVNRIAEFILSYGLEGKPIHHFGTT